MVRYFVKVDPSNIRASAELMAALLLGDDKQPKPKSQPPREVIRPKRRGTGRKQGGRKK